MVNNFQPTPPSLYPDGIVTIWSAGVGGRSASCGEVTERGEKLFHLLLQHLIPALGVVLGALCVAQLDLGHCVLLPLLVQLFVEVQHLCLQLQVALLQAEKEVNARVKGKEEQLLNEQQIQGQDKLIWWFGKH